MAGGFAPWHAQRRRRTARREAVSLLAAGVGVQVLLGVGVLQLRFGPLGAVPAAGTLTAVLMVALVLCAVGFVLQPRRFGLAARRVLGATFGSLLVALTTVALWVLFVLALPFAVSVGRRGFLTRHPTARSWVRPGSSWRYSTWQPKRCEADTANARSRSTVVRLLRAFAAQGNYFLLLVALCALILSTFAALAQSSTVGPFIYVLF
jgi:hypothetical protein